VFTRACSSLRGVADDAPKCGDIAVARGWRNCYTELRGESPPLQGWDEADSQRNGTFVGCDAESEVRIRTPRGGEMKPPIPAWGRTGTAHDPTVGAWGPVRRGVPGLWPGTPRVQSCEDVRSTNRSSPSGAWRRYIPRVSSPVSAARSTIRRRQQVGVGDSESTSPEIEDFWCADESQRFVNVRRIAQRF